MAKITFPLLKLNGRPWKMLRGELTLDQSCPGAASAQPAWGQVTAAWPACKDCSGLPFPSMVLVPAPRFGHPQSGHKPLPGFGSYQTGLERFKSHGPPHPTLGSLGHHCAAGRVHWCFQRL